MPNLVSRTVVLLPSPHVAQEAMTYNSKLASSVQLAFRLNDVDKLTHLSLFQGNYSIEADAEIEIRLAALAKKLSPISVLMSHVALYGRRWVWWYAQRLQALQYMHEQVVQVLNPLRNRELLGTNAELLANPQLSIAGRRSIELYGNPVSMEAFEPHVTVGCLENPDDAERLPKEQPKGTFGFFAYYLVLGEVGPHGTLPRVIRQFRLGTSK